MGRSTTTPVLAGIGFLAVLLLLQTGTAQARMYQWTNPQTGTTQMSGNPPPWYRGQETGPRVFVFENGRIIDDTAIEKSTAQQKRLRSAALKEIALRQQREAEKQAEEAELIQQQLAAGKARAEQAMPSALGKLNDIVQDEDYIQALKSLVAEWDKKNPEVARKAEEAERQLQQQLASPAKR